MRYEFKEEEKSPRERLRDFLTGVSIPVAFVASGLLGNAAGKSVFQRDQDTNNTAYNPLSDKESYIHETMQRSIALANEERFEREIFLAPTDGILDCHLEEIFRNQISNITQYSGDTVLQEKKTIEPNDAVLEAMLAYNGEKMIEAAKWVFGKLEEIADSAAKNKQGIDYDDLYASIERYEGLKTKAYLDTKKIPTIGIGFNLTKNKAKERIEKLGYDYAKIIKGEQEITTDNARTLMKEDLKNAVLDAKNYMGNGWERLDPKAQAILIDMSYNMGANFGGIKSLKALLNQEEPNYAAAAERMKTYAWYEQTGRRGKELTEKMEEIGKKYNSKN